MSGILDSCDLRSNAPGEVARAFRVISDEAFTSDGRLSRLGATRIVQSAVRALVDSDRMGGDAPELEITLLRRGARSPTEI